MILSKVPLLNLLGDLHSQFRGDARLAFEQELLDERCDIPTGNRDVLDARTDHVAVHNRDDVGHTIARIDNGTSEGTLSVAACAPGGDESEGGLKSIKGIRGVYL